MCFWFESNVWFVTLFAFDDTFNVLRITLFDSLQFYARHSMWNILLKLNRTRFCGFTWCVCEQTRSHFVSFLVRFQTKSFAIYTHRRWMVRVLVILCASALPPFFHLRQSFLIPNQITHSTFPNNAHASLTSEASNVRARRICVYHDTCDKQFIYTDCVDFA